MAKKPSLKKIGEDVFISDNVEIKRPQLVSVGNHVAIDTGFYCTTSAVIGDYVHIGPYVTCIGGAEGILEVQGFNNIMAGARIICVSDRFDDSGLFGVMIPDKYLGRRVVAPVILESLSNIGTNAVVLPGSVLRQGVLLTVGSVLMGDTEPWTVYKGNPAVPIKTIDASKALKAVKEIGYEF